MTTAEKIIAFRSLLGYTQQEFCQAFNKRFPELPLTRDAYAKWETGDRALKIEYLKALVIFLKTSADDLLFDHRIPDQLKPRRRKKQVA